MEKVENFISLKTPRSAWIIAILILAGFLRLYRLADYMTFLGDEGRDVLVVYNILHGHLTLLGPTASVGGFFLGPIYYYFMAPFLWLFNYNPVGPAVMVALFGTATVFLIYKIGSEFFNKSVGLIAAFLYSISPIVIAYSRSSWNPNLMPFFSLLILYILYKAVSKNNTKLFIFCGFLLGILMQLHYLAIFVGLILAVYVFLTRLHLDKGVTLTKIIFGIFKDYLAVFLGFIIGWSPFLAFEIKHGFPNIQSIISFIFHSGDTGTSSHFLSIINNVFFRLFGRLVTNFPPPEQVAIGGHKNVALWYYLTLALGVASLIALFRSKNNSGRTLLLTWFILGIGLFGFYKKPIYDYYFGFMFPLPFMLVGNTLVILYTNLHEYARYIAHLISKSNINRGRHEFSLIETMGKVLAISIFLVLAWINLKGMPFLFPANRQLAQIEEISKFVIGKTDNKPFNFALITGGNSDHAYRYFFTIWNRPPVTIKNLKEDTQRNTVTNQLLVICENPPCHPLGHSLWEIAGFGRAEIVDEWDVSVVNVYKLKHYMGKD